MTSAKELKFSESFSRADEVSKEEYDFDANAEKIAAERGCRVVFPEPNQLQLDLDTEEAYIEFKRRFKDMDWGSLVQKGIMKLTPLVEEHFSQAGSPHRHITITLSVEGISEWQRLALQAALGDDPIRHFLNVRRVLYGVENPTRLFEPLDDIGEIVVDDGLDL